MTEGGRQVHTEHWMTIARHTPLGILCDLDGTLVPFASSPEEARPDREAITLIEELAALARGHDVDREWSPSGMARAILYQPEHFSSSGSTVPHVVVQARGSSPHSIRLRSRA